MARRQEVPSPFWYAQRLAGNLLPSTIEALEVRHQNEWRELVSAFRDQDRQSLTSNDQRSIAERVERALPVALRAEFRRLSSARIVDQDAAKRAAFAIGLEVGKRNAGGLL
jgi:hypothetical protein